MNGKELSDISQNMAQNAENRSYEAQQSQPYEASQYQSQLYIPPPQPQTYETSQPQSQVNIPPPQPQTYKPYQQPETPQPQPYQSFQPQTYQQTQPQSYQSPQTPYINPPVTNNMYQNGSNQSSNYVMNPNQNALLDNYRPFQDDNNTPDKGRLTCQMILGIILLLGIISIIEILNSQYRIDNIFILLSIIVNILNLIIGILMIILTIKKKTTRNCCLGIISLFSLIICLFEFSLLIINGYRVSGFQLIDIIFLIIVTSYNMKCNCCD